eukprot:gene20023-21984_t
MWKWEYCFHETHGRKILEGTFLLLLTVDIVHHPPSDNANNKIKAKQIKKDVKDYSEKDIYDLLDQWNENDDEYDPTDDDDPRTKSQPKVQFDPQKMAKDPEGMIKLAKKGKPMMMFVTVAGNPSEKQTEQISSLWQQSLHNAQIQLQRYVVGKNRVLFSLDDGSKAWDVKDYLITQTNCISVDLENRQFPCAGAAAQDTKSKPKSKTEL